MERLKTSSLVRRERQPAFDRSTRSVAASMQDFMWCFGLVGGLRAPGAKIEGEIGRDFLPHAPG